MIVETHGAITFQLDSIEQRASYKSGGDDRGWERTLRGQLRAALLYSGALVILDTQVFDGALLLELGPSGLLSMLGLPAGTPAVTVMCRAHSARASCEQMLSPTFRSQVALAAPQVASRADALRHAWWEALGNEIVIRQWPPASEFDFAATLRSELLKSGGPPGSLEAGLAEALIGTITRSSMQELVANQPAPLRDAIAAWWEGAYMDTVALQHRARWIHFSDPDEHAAPPPAVRAPRDLVAKIPRIVIERLSELDADSFSRLYAQVSALPRVPYRRVSQRTSGRELGHAIRDAGQRARRRARIALVIARALAPDTPILDFLGAMLRLLAWAFAWHSTSKGSSPRSSPRTTRPSRSGPFGCSLSPKSTGGHGRAASLTGSRSPRSPCGGPVRRTQSESR